MSTEDHDGDSQMISSPEDSDVATPHSQILPPSSVLSPPDSQHRPEHASSTATTDIATSSMPLSPTGVPGANANGKRPINTISNGADDETAKGKSDKAAGKQRQQSLAPAQPQQDFPTKTHTQSGYTWNRLEGEPGYAWLNKKAVDEYHRANEALLHREHQVRGRYGDPFEMVDKERAMLNSLKQQ